MRIRSLLVLLTATSILLAASRESEPVPAGLEYRQIKKIVRKEARPNFKKADELLKKGRVPKAEQYFLASIKVGECFYGNWGRAWCAWQQNDTARARLLFKQAIVLNDSLLSFLENYALFATRGVKDWNLTVNLTRKIYRLNPTDEVLLNFIEVARQFNASEKALTVLGELVKQYPRRSNARIFYAILLQEMGKQEEATKIARVSLKNTQDPFHLKLIVLILANNGYFVDGAKACEKLTQVAPRSAHTFEAWGFLEYKQGHYANAARHYQKALNREYRVATLLTLARLYLFHLNEPAKVRYYCKAVLQMQRDNADAYYYLTENARRKGDLKTALKYSQRLIELLPDHPQPYYYHGKLLYDLKDYSQAVIFLEKAVQANPDIRRYRLVLAKAYAAAGMLEKAQATYNNYLKEPLKDLWQEEEMLKETPPVPR